MAITQAQRQQAARLPVANGTLDESGDRYALAGIIQALSVGSSNITQAQRQQMARMPVADGTLNAIGDRYAMAGIVQSIDTTGAIVDQFETTWLIDPSWDAYEGPQSNDGNVFAEIGGFVFSFVGLNVHPDFAPADPDQIAIGIPLTQVFEETSFTATVRFRDRATKMPATPTTARYRIDCISTGKTVQDWTDLTATSGLTLAVAPRNNRIRNWRNKTERKRLLVETNADLTSKTLGSVVWTVKKVIPDN